MATEKASSGLDDTMRSRLYFYNELAGTYPRTGRVRRNRAPDSLQKVPKDVIDSFLSRVSSLLKPTPKKQSINIPVRIFDETDLPLRQNSAVVQSSLLNRNGAITPGASVPKVLLNPLESVGRFVKRFRTDKYVYVANDANHTSAKTSFLRFPNRIVVVSLIVAGVFIAGLGSYLYLRQQSVQRQNAIEQTQFEEQRQAWQCALQTYEQQQGKQLTKEEVCSR